MKLDDFADTMQSIADASGSNAKVEILKDTLDRLGPNEDAVVFARVALGELFDDPGRNTNVQSNRVLSAVSDLTGVTRDDLDGIEEAHGKTTDAVEYAFSNRQQQGVIPATATLTEIYHEIERLPDADGDKHREQIVQEMFGKAQSAREARWISYCILSDLSLGMGWKTMAKAFAQLYSLDYDELVQSKRIVGTLPAVMESYFDTNDLQLTPELGQPFKPMLAEGGSVASDYGNGWVAQTKYDGARVLIHNHKTVIGSMGFGDQLDPSVKLFSRNQNDVTESLPEIVEAFQNNGTEMILDAEVVGFKDGEVQPFQQIMRRFRRQHNVEELAEEIEAVAYVFDILMLDGEWIGDKPAYERYDLIPNEIANHDSIEIAIMSNDIESLYRESLEEGHEGVVVKKWDAPWEFSRSSSWQKLKPTETLDLRVKELKGGTGKHADKLGAFVLETEEGIEVGNVGTGFSDEEREDLDTDAMIGKIVEIKAEELQKSGGSFGLRFPRFEAVRMDKDEADEIEKVKEVLGYDG